MKLVITHPKSDGNIEGQKFIIDTNQCPLIWSSYADSHFTILGFTTATGQSVCCIVIMACQEVEAKFELRLQPWAEINGEVTTNPKENANRTNKYYPHGPTCVYKWQRNPMLHYLQKKMLHHIWYSCSNHAIPWPSHWFQLNWSSILPHHGWPWQ